jgi:feruloyl-CoA synthase
VPLPGIELNLAPADAGDSEYELRLRGPNVTPGFHRRPELHAETFDTEGYLRTGDLISFVDDRDPNQGLLFSGRIAENFKLSTGTFVQVGTVRPRLLSASAGVLQDAVICGHNGEFVAALAWLHQDHAHRADREGLPDDDLRAGLAECLNRLAASVGGSSQRVDRLLILTDPPALDAGEITDKGYINQRAVRENRAALVAELTAMAPSVRCISRVAAVSATR